MGAGNVSIVGQPGTFVAPDRESQIQLLMTQGMTRSKAEMCLDQTWAADNVQAQNIDSGFPKSGTLTPKVAQNEYGKAIPIDSYSLETNHLPLK